MKFNFIIVAMWIVSSVAIASDNQLDEVAVSSTSIAKGGDVKNMDVSTTVITSDDIKKSPQLSLDQILNKEVGIWTRDTMSTQIEPSSPAVGIRGFGNTGGEKVLVMVDGTPINDGLFNTIDWNQIPKDTIDRVEIVRGGGASVLWGNLAEGGTINIVTKMPGNNTGEGNIGFSYGSFNTKKGDGSITLFANDKIKVGATANVTDTDGYNSAPKEFRGQSGLVNSETQIHNVGVSTIVTPSDMQKYYAKISAHQQLQDNYNYDIASNDWKKIDGRTGGEIWLNKNTSANYNAFYNYTEMDKINGTLVNVKGSSGLTPNFNNVKSIVEAGTMPAQYETGIYHTYGANAYMSTQFEVPFGSIHDIKYGIDINGKNVSDVNDMQKQTSNTSTNNYTFASLDANAKNLFEGIFAQGTFTPSNIPLDVTLGLRYDWWQSFDGSINSTFFNSNGTTKSVSNLKPKEMNFDQFNPRLGLKYSFDNGIDIRGAVYRNFAAPNMAQQFRTTVSGTTIQFGNTQLLPETNFGKEIGLDFHNSDKTFNAQFTLFHNNLSNYITLMSMCGGTGQSACNLSEYNLVGSGMTQVRQSMNVGEAVMEGGEAFISWKPIDKLMLTAGYTKTIAFIDSFDGQFANLNNSLSAIGKPLMKSSRQLNNVPTDVILLGGSYDILDDLTFNWKVKTWSKYYTNTVENDTYINDAGTTADVGLSYKPIKNLELFTIAQNISNEYYTTRGRDNIPTLAAEVSMPRNIYGGFNFKF